MNIHESLQRILRDKELIGQLFYEVFFERCPEAQPYFAQVNLRHQAVVLTMALRVIEDHYVHGYPSLSAYLKYLGHKHHAKNIPLELYPRFGEALLATLERFHGGDWDEEAAQQWREAIEKASATMELGYQQPFHV